MPNIIWLDKLEEKDGELCGIKALRISDLIRKNFPTVPGFVITHSAYEKFMEDNNLKARILDLTEEFEEMDLENLKNFYRDFAKDVAEAQIPWELEVEILSVLKQSGFSYPLVLRPSYSIDISSDVTLDEDGKERTGEIVYKGIDKEALGSRIIGMRSYLNITNEKSLRSKITAIWQAFYNFEMLRWLKENSANPSRIKLGIVVQPMVATDAYGSMISFLPDPSGKKAVQIRARSGFCSESLYDPTPDLEVYNPNRNVPWDIYTVDRASMAVLSKKPTIQAMEFFPRPTGGLGQQPVPYERGTKPKVSDSIIESLAKIAMNLEKEFSVPVYVQWGIKDEKPYIFEYRRMEALKKEIDENTRKDELIETTGEVIQEETISEGTTEDMVQSEEIIPPPDQKLEENWDAVTEVEYEMPVMNEIPVQEGNLNFEEIHDQKIHEPITEEKPEEMHETGATVAYTPYTNDISVLLYSDITGRLPSSIHGDGAVLWIDSYLWSVLKKHPLYWIRNKDTEDALRKHLRDWITLTARSVYPGNVVVVLSHMSPVEYATFENGNAYEDLDDEKYDTHISGMERMLKDDEFAKLYELEASIVAELISEGLDNLSLGVTGTENLEYLDDGLSRILDIMENSDGYIEDPDSYLYMLVDSPGTLMTAEAALEYGLSGYIIDYKSILDSVYGSIADRSAIKFRDSIVDFVLGKMIDASLEQELEVIFRIKHVMRSRTVIDRLIQMGISSICTPQEELEYLARIISSTERRILLRGRK